MNDGATKEAGGTMGGRYMRALAYVALALMVTMTSCQAVTGAPIAYAPVSAAAERPR